MLHLYVQINQSNLAVAAQAVLEIDQRAAKYAVGCTCLVTAESVPVRGPAVQFTICREAARRVTQVADAFH